MKLKAAYNGDEGGIIRPLPETGKSKEIPALKGVVTLTLDEETLREIQQAMERQVMRRLKLHQVLFR